MGVLLHCRLPEPERMGSNSGSLAVDDGSQETWSSWTAHWLRRASSADLMAQGSGTPSEWSATDGQASSNLSMLS